MCGIIQLAMLGYLATSAPLPLSTPEILTGLEPRTENPYPLGPLLIFTQRGASQLFSPEKVGSGPYTTDLTIL